MELLEASRSLNEQEEKQEPWEDKRICAAQGEPPVWAALARNTPGGSLAWMNSPQGHTPHGLAWTQAPSF